MPLLLDKPALAGAVGNGVILQRALAALVAHGAVKWVVDEEVLENTLLGLLDDGGLRVDDHAIVDGCGAGRNEHRTAGTDHLDKAHTAHPDGLHPGMPAETGDVVAVLLSNLDEDFAGAALHLDAINGDRDQIRHRPPPPGSGYRC